MGRLFEEEYCVISGLMEKPAHPCVFLLGGSKINDAFMMMTTVLGSGIADKVLAGGLVGQVLHWGNGDDIGQASRAYIVKQGYDNLVEKGRELLEKYSDKIILPADFGYVKDGKRFEKTLGDLPQGDEIMDIGSRSSEEFKSEIMNARTVFVNGPVGVYETSEGEAGTKTVWDALEKSEAYTVVGGGDSITATKKYGTTVSYICTGGGALVRFLSGEELPVVKALRHGSKHTGKLI